MNNSESDFKQEMIVDEMEDLVEDQVWDGLGFCLKFLLALRMRDSAVTPLEKLRAFINNTINYC